MSIIGFVLKKGISKKLLLKPKYSHFKYLVMPFGLANVFITF